jgi:predicted Fe-S protein YdhL (DUF1289 family)
MNATRPDRTDAETTADAGSASSAPAPTRPAFAGRTRSPCISVCRIDPADGLCIGCHRTIDEISNWGSMTPEQRIVVWQLIGERRTIRASANLGRPGMPVSNDRRS